MLLSQRKEEAWWVPRSVSSKYLRVSLHFQTTRTLHLQVAWERERVAAFLLSEGHYLAALELHQDLLEVHGESVSELENFFNDPTNLANICPDDPELETDADPLV
jgi:hypothetical protein